MTPIKKAYLAILTTVVLWGSSFVAIRMGLPDFGPGELAFLRYMVASLVMLPVYFSIKDRRKLQTKHVPIIIFFGVVGIGLYNIALNVGQVTVPAGAASFILSQIPTVTIIFAVFSLKERLTNLSWLGIAISISGVLLISLGQMSAGNLNQGVFYLVAAVFCGGFYSGFQRFITPFYNPLQLVSLYIWCGTLSLSAYVFPLWHQLPQASWSTILAGIYLGIFPGAIGYICWTYALKLIPASKAASYLFSLPIVATLLGWLLLSEVPLSMTIIGGAIAISGAFLVKIKKPKDHEQTNT